LQIRADGTAYFKPDSGVSIRYMKESLNWKLEPEVLQRIQKRLRERIAKCPGIARLGVP
jgi:hypothetical protein